MATKTPKLVTEENLHGVLEEANALFVIILDITGSMGSQIEGVKKATRNFIAQLSHKAKAEGYSLAIITFTESGSGCYVSMAAFDDFEEAGAYVGRINLSRPPDAPNVSAHGGDGPENLKAALWRLLELPNKPTFVSLITDAPPHLNAFGGGGETRQENKWFEARDVPQPIYGDFYVCFKQVQDHFGENLFVLPVLYGPDRNALQVGLQIALKTKSLVLSPSGHNSNVLANALTQIASYWMDREPNTNPEIPDGIQVYGVDVGMREKHAEADSNAAVPAPVGGAAAAALYGKCMEAFKTITGKNFGKRAVPASVATIAKQVQLVMQTLRLATGQSADLATPCALLGDLKESLPDGQKGHLSLTDKILEELRETAPLKDMVDAGAADVVTLETVLEKLNDMDEMADRMKFLLENVMRLLPCSMVNIKFMNNPLTGDLDFATSWMTVFPDRDFVNPSSALVSAADVLALGGRCPHDGKEYSAGLPLVDPQDGASRLLYRLMSRTQLLDVTTLILMRGPPGMVFPNLAIGTVSRFVMRCAQEPLTANVWRHLRRGAATAREYAKMPCSDLLAQLTHVDGPRANPADPISQFVVLCLKNDFRCGTPQFELLLRESATGCVQHHYGKQSPENNAEYFGDIKALFPLAVPLDTFDPTEGKHPLEPDDSDMADVVEGFDESVLFNLPLFDKFKHWIRIFAALVSCENLCEEDLPVIPAIEEVMGANAADILKMAILLRFRTERYDVVDAGHVPKRLEVKGLLLARLRTAYSDDLRRFKERRVSVLTNRLVLDLLRKKSIVRALNNPKKTHGELHGVAVRIKRGHVPKLLKAARGRVELSEPVLRELLLGDWSSEPPATLKGYADEIRPLVPAQLFAEFEASLHVGPVCKRHGSANRHGHSADFDPARFLPGPYPGPLGWTEAYAGARRTSRERLDNMKACTLFAQEMLAREMDEPMRIEVNKILMKWSDPNMLNGHGGTDDKPKERSMRGRINKLFSAGSGVAGGAGT